MTICPLKDGCVEPLLDDINAPQFILDVIEYGYTELPRL